MIWLYNLVLPAARLLIRLASFRRPKIRDGIRGRQQAEKRLLARAVQETRPVVWLHSSSVGEYEQARPVARLLQEQRPHVALLHTFFSPSGYHYAQRLGEAAWMEYLPEDTRGRMSRILEAIRPAALVFVKFDLWPNLVAQAHARRIPMLLIDATLHAKSLRSRWPARTLYAQLYRQLDVISAVTEQDAERFRLIVPRHPNIVVDGDTRFDQVLRRRETAGKVQLSAWITRKDRPFTLLAGSTWGPDEALVLPAWDRFRRSLADKSAVRLILAPHEPTPQHLQPIEKALQARDMSYIRMQDLAASAVDDTSSTEPAAQGALPHDTAEVLLVDRVGVLAELYAHADCAYIGGAFTTGVHNVMEPAIARLPIWFGPRHHNAPEAAHLLEAGVAGVVRSPAELQEQIQTLWREPQVRIEKGAAARAYVESNLGASRRCLNRILEVLPEPSRLEERS